MKLIEYLKVKNKQYMFKSTDDFNDKCKVILFEHFKGSHQSVFELRYKKTLFNTSYITRIK